MINKPYSKFVFNKATDKIAIIAPSSHTSGYENILIQAVEKFKSLGFILSIPDDLINPTKSIFYANDDNSRTKFVIDAINDPLVKILWCYRGGAGCSEVVRRLMEKDVAKDLLHNVNKILVGFSDVSFLHIFWNQFLDSVSIHGSMIADIRKEGKNIDLVLDLIASSNTAITYDIQLNPMNEAAKNAKTINSKICGGNLAILSRSCGTDYQIKAENKMLLLEDTGERGYKIIEMLSQLIDAKVINKSVDAIIICDFVNSDDNLDIALSNFLDRMEERELYLPCFRAKNIGHGEINLPIPFNVDCKIIGKDSTYVLSFDYDNFSICDDRI